MVVESSAPGPFHPRLSDLPPVLPVFPLSGALLLPWSRLPLNIFERRYLSMVQDALGIGRMIGMVQPVGGALTDSETLPSLFSVGCAGRISSFSETPDGRLLITLTGVCRFAVATEMQVRTPYRQVRADFLPYEADLRAPDPGDNFDREPFLSALAPYLAGRGLDIDWDTARAAPQEALVNSLAMALPFDPPEKQALLEAMTLEDRAEALTALLRIDAASDGDDDGPAMQ